MEGSELKFSRVIPAKKIGLLFFAKKEDADKAVADFNNQYVAPQPLGSAHESSEDPPHTDIQLLLAFSSPLARLTESCSEKTVPPFGSTSLGPPESPESPESPEPLRSARNPESKTIVAPDNPRLKTIAVPEPTTMVALKRLLAALASTPTTLSSPSDDKLYYKHALSRKIHAHSRLPFPVGGNSCSFHTLTFKVPFQPSQYDKEYQDHVKMGLSLAGPESHSTCKWRSSF